MFIANNICTSVFLMKISRSRAVVNLKARLRGSVVFEFGAGEKETVRRVSIRGRREMTHETHEEAKNVH